MSDYYSKLISDYSHTSRKLWHVLRKTLNRVTEMTLPSHESDKSLADQFAFFFLNKIKTIRDTFIPSGTENDVPPPSDPLKITAFIQVSEDTADKIIRNSPIKSCLLDHGKHFSSRSVAIYYYNQLQSWSTAHSWRIMSLMVLKLL